MEEMEGIDRNFKEIYEWWFVTSWLYEKLKKHNEPVLDCDYGYLWGRTCTGQAISLDGVIEQIYDSKGKLSELTPTTQERTPDDLSKGPETRLKRRNAR